MRTDYKTLGNYIKLVDTRNRDLAITNLLGVSIEKKFIPSIANIVGTDLSSYKVVRTGQFAYGPVTSRNGEKISIAYLDGEDCIISSSYSVFEVSNKEELDPEYLMLWFRRPEFDRYARYKSHGSVREIFDWNELCMVELPVPDIEEQKKIVKAYKAITDRIALMKRINDNLTALIQAIFERLFQEEDVSVSDIIIKNKTAPCGWGDSTISEFAQLQTGPFGTQLHSDEYVSFGTPVINVKNIGYGHIVSENLDYLSEETCERLSSHRLLFGDIVFGRKGSIDRHAFINTEQEGWIQGSDCIRVRPKNIQMGHYIHRWFSQSVIQQLIVSSSVGSTMASLNTKILGDIRILIPPESKLSLFSKYTDNVMNVIAANQAEIHELTKMLSVIQESLSR